MPNNKTFTLYLAKDRVENFDDILTEAAKSRINSPNTFVLESNILGEKSRLYLFKNNPTQPHWLEDIRGLFPDIPAIQNSSSSAIIIFRCLDRIFITPFAHGWQYIDDAKIESDFGLRVSINSIDDDKLRRIDRSNLAEAMKGVSQSAFQREPQAFGVDEALDLVRRVTGRADGDDFAKNLSGSTSLKITREMSLSEIGKIAEETLKRFKSTRYKKTAFQIIDKIHPISDPAITEKLDKLLVDDIKSNRNNFELSMPGQFLDDVIHYGFIGLNVNKRYPDLLIKNYREELGGDIESINVSSLTRHGVFAEIANDAMSKKKWSIKKSLIGSIVIDSGLYAINEGEWYRVDEQFKSDIDDSFESIRETWEYKPLILCKKVSTDSRKSGFESEFDYNRRCANAYNQICLDQEILTVPSIPYGRFEACDLLDIKNKRLIHVKKSSRQSSVLSHFFKQGGNSARILRNFPESQDVLVDKVGIIAGNEASENLRAAMASSLSGWKIEFHIIDAPRPDNSFKIPFFSRITLREEVRLLKGMTFDVAIKFIPT